MATTLVTKSVAHEGSSSSGNSVFAGARLLARLAFRRSRVFYVVWVLALWLTMVATPAAYEQVVPLGANRDVFLSALGGNPTMRAMLGPAFDLGTAGGFTMWRVGTFAATALAFMAAFGVIRATRAEEEDGRSELLRAGAIGRHASLLAGVAVASLACLVCGVLVAASMPSLAPPASGAVATGAGIALVGLVGAGVGAVFAQVSETARGARGLASAVLGGAYLLRAIADGSANESGMRSLAWLSPVEWAALARPYAGERWWVLVLPLALGVGLVLLAFRLESMRDTGSGLRRSSNGPARASESLGSAWGLSQRLDRAGVLGWAAGLAVFGLSMGSISDAFGTMLKDMGTLAEVFKRLGGGAEQMTDAFFVAMLGLLVITVSMMGVQLVGMLHREEEGGRVELMLSTAVSRKSLALSHLVPALMWPTVLMGVTGGLLGVSHAVNQGSFRTVWDVALAGLVLTPGVWVIVGVAMVLLGWFPRWAGLAWALPAWSLFAAWFGQILQLPQWVIDATPFAALPAMPVEPLEWTPVVVTALVAGALCLVGVMGFRRRDIG